MSDPTAAEFTEQALPHVYALVEAPDPQWRDAAYRLQCTATTDATAYMLACGLCEVASSFIHALRDLGVPVPITEHTPHSREEAENMITTANWQRDQMNGTGTFADFAALVERGPRFMAEFFIFLMLSVRQLGREVAYQEAVKP